MATPKNAFVTAASKSYCMLFDAMLNDPEIVNHLTNFTPTVSAVALALFNHMKKLLIHISADEKEQEDAPDGWQVFTSSWYNTANKPSDGETWLPEGVDAFFLYKERVFFCEDINVPAPDVSKATKELAEKYYMAKVEGITLLSELARVEFDVVSAEAE